MCTKNWVSKLVVVEESEVAVRFAMVVASFVVELVVVEVELLAAMVEVVLMMGNVMVLAVDLVEVVEQSMVVESFALASSEELEHRQTVDEDDLHD